VKIELNTIGMKVVID